MRLNRVHGIALTACLASLALALPVLAEELRGTVKSVDRVNSRMVVHDEMAQRDVVVNFNKLTALKSKDSSLSDLKDVKPGSRISITDSVTASRVTVDDASPDGDRAREIHARGVLVQLPAQPVQAALALLLPRVPGPDPAGPRSSSPT